jgi:hypothetical protein
MNKKILVAIIVTLLVIIIILGLRFLSGEDSWICVDGKWVKHGNPSASMPENGCGNNQPAPQAEIIITSPQNNQIISSPFKIEGKARGSWFFEAVFPIKLLDGNGKQIVEAPAQAIGEWMTEDFVPFNTTINFSASETDSGTLLFQNDNPSGLPENSKEFRLPVRFR